MKEKQSPKKLSDYFDKYKGIADAYFTSEKVPNFQKTAVVVYIVTVIGLVLILSFKSEEKTLAIIGLLFLSLLIIAFLMVRGNS